MSRSFCLLVYIYLSTMQRYLFVRSSSSFNRELLRKNTLNRFLFSRLLRSLSIRLLHDEYRFCMCLGDRVSLILYVRFLAKRKSRADEFRFPSQAPRSLFFFLLPSSLSLLSLLFSLSRSRQQLDLPCARTLRLQAKINQRYSKLSSPSCNKSS